MEEGLMFSDWYKRIEKITTLVLPRIVGITTLVLFIAVMIFEIVLIYLIKSFYIGNVRSVLKSELITDSTFYNSKFYDDELDKTQYESAAKDFVKKFVHLPYHIQVTDNRGNILAETLSRHEFNVKIYPDVQEALKNKLGVFIGKDISSQTKIMAMSTPITGKEEMILGVIRFSVSLENTYDAMNAINYFFIVFGLVIILLSIIISTIISKTITKPIQHITNISNEMAKGNLSIRAEKHRNDEIGILSDAINHMADEIQKSENLKNEFISSVSHELRTPLTSIRGWSITLKNTPLEDKEDIVMGIDIITEESERLSTMVEELLDFSRLTSNTLVLSKKNFDINDLIKRVLYQLKHKAKSKNIILGSVLKERSIIIFGDENRLKQVLINVIDNAIKFTPESGEIKVQLATFENEILIIVKDNGIGISKEEIAQIKQKFVKGKNTGDLKGLGLGLAISDEIINGHNGSLIVKSEKSIGTEIMIKIPV